MAVGCPARPEPVVTVDDLVRPSAQQRQPQDVGDVASWLAKPFTLGNGGSEAECDQGVARLDVVGPCVQVCHSCIEGVQKFERGVIRMVELVA